MDIPIRRFREPLTWKQVSEELRTTQDLITSHKARFTDAGYPEVADELEGCVHTLLGAQCIAEEISMRNE